MEQNNINSNEKIDWYEKRKKHWELKEATLLSVLGGWEDTHLPDIKCSNELLNGLILTNQLKPEYALDCGAGIGRVTSNVLINFFNNIDLFEKNENFVKKCEEIFKNIPKIKNIYLSSLENFNFKQKYDLIWVQWCLENLEDEDLIPFLNKCKENLNDKGKIIVKENCYYDENDEDENNNLHNKEYEYSNEDFSKQRLDSFYINLFINNGFKIINHFINPNWPKTIMPLIVYVLEKTN